MQLGHIVDCANSWAHIHCLGQDIIVKDTQVQVVEAGFHRLPSIIFFFLPFAFLKFYVPLWTGYP